MAKTVLIVDDDLAFAEMACQILEDHGFETVTARDALEAIEKLESLRPDGILLDLGMPGMDGTELLQRLKADPKTKYIPVIVCTISQEMGVRDQLLEIGAFDFVHKTTYFQDLVSRLEKAVDSAASGP